MLLAQAQKGLTAMQVYNFHNMKKILSTISKLLLIATLVLSLNTQIVEASIVQNNNIIEHSWLRITIDGVDERLTSASDPSYSTDTKTNGRTLCMWFDLDSLPASESSKVLFFWSNSDAQGVWTMRIRTDRAAHGWSGTRFELQTANDTGSGTSASTLVYSSAQTFAADTLYHLCLVSSGTAWTLFVNGSSTTLTVGAAGVGGNDGDWWGNVAGSGTITFYAFGTTAVSTDGQFDYLSYFDDDLTSTEISLLYNGGKPIDPISMGLIDVSAFWRLGETEGGSVSTFYDVVGGDNFAGTNMESSDIISSSYY